MVHLYTLNKFVLLKIQAQKMLDLFYELLRQQSVCGCSSVITISTLIAISLTVACFLVWVSGGGCARGLDFF